MTEGFSKDEYGTLSITGEAAVAIAQAHTRVSALCLSITIGGRPGLMQAMAEQCGSPKRTKAGVLQDYVVWLYSLGLTLEHQWATIQRALGEDKTAKLKRHAEKAAKKAQELAEVEKLLKPIGDES